MTSSLLPEILYNPVSYVNPLHLPAVFSADAPSDGQLINFWLHRVFQLEDLPAGWQPSDVISQLLIKGWSKLPLTTRLVGSYLIKPWLVQRHMHIRQSLLRAFITLPLRYQAVLEPGLQEPESYGFSFILCLLKNHPAAIRQRFQLMIPPGAAARRLTAPLTPDNINLFRMAINYANYSPCRTTGNEPVCPSDPQSGEEESPALPAYHW